MTSPPLNPERRQAPRSTVNKIAYINLDLNNGAIVLNVSTGGLCFHSVAPIQRSESIRFWFSENNRRIEVDGQLAWMDETQKTAGLRFANLSTEARLQVRSWMRQPVAPASAKARLVPSPSEMPVLNIRRPEKDALHDGSTPSEVRSPDRKVPALLSGFSAGLVFGILVSTLAAGAFLFHAYREFGNSLTQLDERLGVSSQAQTVAPASKAASSVPRSNRPPAQRPTQAQPRAVNPPQGKAVAPPPVTSVPAPTESVGPSGRAQVISSVKPTSSPQAVVEREASDIRAAAKVESTNRPAEHIEDSRAVETRSYSTMYLEVGKFHDQTKADRATDRLKQLGFPATAVHKSLFWINSYRVLVGPYNSENEARAARDHLVASGFRPRAYERGSRSFWLPKGLTLQGTQIPFGDCVVSWESYVTDAFVTFEKDGSVVTRAEGKWMERGARYQENGLVYQRNVDGSRTLLEIRFAGLSRALVFGESS
jgi:cell division protein FtsN